MTGSADGVPAVVSARATMRLALPSIYRDEGGFAMRFVYALERVLDPRVAIVESLAAYLSPRLAPAGMVDAMAGWLGLALGDAPAGIPRRELLGSAERIAQTRGTRAGVELALRLSFPELELHVRDHGGVVVLAEGDAPPPRPFPGFLVHCHTELSPADRAAVEWAIERQRPMHVPYRLVAVAPTESAR